MKTLQELCLAPEGEAAFIPERLQQVEQTLVEDHRADMPWYLRAIVAIGAWLASLFFLAFIIVLVGWQDEHQTTIGTIGIVMLVAAVAVGRQPWGIFVGQCALAVSMAGQIMIYYGFADNPNPLGRAATIALGLAFLLYLVFPNFLSRLMTCFTALQLTLFWLYSDGRGDLFSDYQVQSDLSQIVFLYWGFHLGALCWCFLKPQHSVFLSPLGYALIASLAAWQIESLFNLWTHFSVITFHPAWLAYFFLHLRPAMTALALFGVAIWAAGGMSTLLEKAPLFMGFALGLALLVALGSGGVLLALLLMLLGFSLQHRPILGLGIILFPIFLTHYYYNLNLDLLAKSGVLIGSGIVMLMLRAGVSRWLFADLKEAA